MPVHVVSLGLEILVYFCISAVLMTRHFIVITLTTVRVIIKVSGRERRWLAGGYDLEIGHSSYT